MKISTIIVLGIVAVLVGVYVLGINVPIINDIDDPDDDDGVSAPQVTIILTEQATNEVQSEVITTDESIVMTTFSPTLFNVNPNAQYIVEFVITYEFTTPTNMANGTEFSGYAKMSGHKFETGVTDHVFYNVAKGFPDGQLLSTQPQPIVGNTATASFTIANGLAFDQDYRNLLTTHPAPIYGSTLGGSVWNVNCTAMSTHAGTDAYYGTTQFTINMTLGGENLEVTATGIDVTISSP